MLEAYIIINYINYKINSLLIIYKYYKFIILQNDLFSNTDEFCRKFVCKIYTVNKICIFKQNCKIHTN